MFNNWDFGAVSSLTKTEGVKVTRVEARGTCPLDMSSDHLHSRDFVFLWSLL